MADMSREFVNTIVFRPPSQRESGAASTTDLAKMKKEEYRMVLRNTGEIQGGQPLPPSSLTPPEW